MYYVYIIKSKKNGTIYSGYSENLKQRFIDHNLGKSNYTKKLRPWVLVCYEVYASKGDAQARERQLKKCQNVMAFLKKRISNSINIS